MNQYDVIASGYISFDRIIKIDRPAHTGITSIVLNADSATPRFGGCSVNICYLLAKLGKKTLPIVRVGDDAEPFGFYEYLDKVGVSREAIRKVTGTTTSHAYLIEDQEGEHITLFHPGSMAGKHAQRLDNAWFKDTRLAVISVGSETDNRSMLEHVKANQIPLLFGMKLDPAAFSQSFLNEILSESTYLFMNHSEALSLCSLLSLKNITDLFSNKKLKVLAVTQGSKGSIVYENTPKGYDKIIVPAIKLDHIVDLAGAGDAYLAGFAYGLLENSYYERCAEYGSTLSSFVLQGFGCTTGAPDKSTFLERHEANYGGRP